MTTSSNSICAKIEILDSGHSASQPQKLGWSKFAGVVLAAIATLAFAASAFASDVPHRTLSLPISFEQNRGQADSGYGYVFRRDGMAAMFFRNGIDVRLPGIQGDGQKVRLQFIAGNASPAGKDQLDGRVNYLLGSDSARWIRSVPTYKEVEYKDIYPGISLSFYGNGRELEHDFNVEAGVDPSAIAFRLEEAQGVDLNADGCLKIHLGASTLTLRKPVAYQDLAGGRKEVKADFVLAEDGTVRFRLGAHDAGAALVIDPAFVFSTYLDGTGIGRIGSVATDSAGNIYVTGETGSASFPLLNPEQSQMASVQSAFVTKLDPTGTKLIYSTYLGGSGTDLGAAIGVDGSGDAIVAGVSTSVDFPHAGSVQPISCQYNGTCYFLASLSPDGSRLNYSGEIGGSAAYFGSNGELAVDRSGNAFLSGDTSSADFQITAGTLSPTVPGYPYSTLFVMKVDPSGKLLYSTIIPGNDTNASFVPYGISVDASGQATIGGMAAPGLPTTTGVVQKDFPNPVGPTATAGFVLQLNSTASAINFASYLPGTDGAGGMAVDAKGNLYLVGATMEHSLPTTANAFEKTVDTGYIMELSAGATSVKAATYLNGPTMYLPYGISAPMGIDLESNGNVVVAGMSQNAGLPMKNPFTPIYEIGSFGEALEIVELAPDLSSLVFGSYLSSTDADIPGSAYGAMTMDKGNHLILAGSTNAVDFPTTANSYEPVLSDALDPLSSVVPATFISSIDLTAPSASACLDAYTEDGEAQPGTIVVTNCGNAPLHIQSVDATDPSFVPSENCGTIPVGSSCPVSVAVTPLHSGESTGTVNIHTDASVSEQKVIFGTKGTFPSLDPPAGTFSLGHQLVGTSGTLPLTILNYGNAQAIVTGVVVNGTSFSVSSYICNLLSLGGSCIFQVTFTPQAPGFLSGSLVIASNDPVNPHLVVDLSGTGDSAEPSASISSLSPPVGLINNGPIPIRVLGANFYPSSVLQVNGNAHAATYVSNNEIDFTLAAPTSTGHIPITVVNPTSSGASAPVSFAPYQVVGINPAFLTSVPSTGMLYAAMSKSDPNHPNTVLPITGATGAVGTPIQVGIDPALLAVSSDGQYLYVALAADKTVQRINLKTQAVERTFPYPNASLYPYPYTGVATDLQVVPGAPLQVVLAQSSTLTLYNDTGLVNTVFSQGEPFDSVTFAGNPLTVYGLNRMAWSNPFTEVNLSESGLQLPGVTFANGYTGYAGGTVVSDGTLLYTDNGEVWNPASKTMTGSFALNPNSSTPALGTIQHNLAIDLSLGDIFGIEAALSPTGGDSGSIAAYDTQTLRLTSEQALPDLSFPQILDLSRWGTDGFAFVNYPSGYATPGVYLIRSSIVNAAAPNPVPVLHSLSPTNEVAGTTNYPLTLTANGANFTPNSVICWNGKVQTTVFVSGSQLTAVVDNSLFASPGTAQITVVTPAPGGGTSNALAFPIISGQPIVSLTATALDFGNVQVGSASSTQYVTVANLAPKFLRIASITASGDFSSTSTCTSNLTYLSTSMVCQIAVAFNPTAAGSRTGTVTITDNAADSPQLIRLSGTGFTAAKAAPSLTVTASAGTITDQQSVNVSVSVAGGAGASTPSGSVSLTGGVYIAQESLVGGSASFTVPGGAFVSGANTLTASYLGDATYGTTSATTSITIAPLVIAAPAPSPVSAGNSATTTATLSAGSTFSGTENLACILTSSPAGAQSLPTCSLNPASVPILSKGSATTVLTMHTTAASTATNIRPSGNLWGLGSGVTALAFLCMFGAPGRRRRWIFPLILFAVSVAGVASCGGGGGSQGVGSTGVSTPATTPGAYVFTVTGTDSFNPLTTASTKVNLTVQ
jgi:hypothetical protein